MKIFVITIGLIIVISANANVKTIKAKADPKGCYTGEIIVGTGKYKGKMEFVGCEAQKTVYTILGKPEVTKQVNTKSILLTPDEKGRYLFPSTRDADITEGLMYLLPKREGQAPLFIGYEGTRKVIETSLYPRYDLSSMVKEGKITPWIAPDIMPPLEVIKTKKGKLIEGYVWCITSKKEQLGL